MHQPHDGWEATLQSHSVLRNLAFRMPKICIMIYSNFLCAIIDTQKMCIFYLLLQRSFTLFYSILEMKMCEFYHENLTDRAVILFNCPKGRKVT